MARSRSDLWIRIVLGMVLLVHVEVVAQDRTFAPEPDVLLGLNTDRSASLTFADLDGDLDVIVANSDGLNGIHLNLAVDSDQGSGEHGPGRTD